MKPIQYIVKKYRQQRGLSLRRFAEALQGDTTLSADLGMEISHQTIKNWEDGNHKPQFSFLMMLAMTARDWRGDFAFDCLAALRPQFYEPMTKIGSDAIEKYSNKYSVSEKNGSEQSKEK
ncbi:MAG: helix-turn-helix domain-containing protein [Brevefilum sp.]|jgi:transcriptional regulator with XRE-family HTH domain